MSFTTPTTAPFAISDKVTLARVLEIVRADPNLAARRRQEMSSALNTVGKILNRSLEEIDAHPGRLRQQLQNYTPAMAGLTQRRWNNVLSLLRAGLKLAGLAKMPGRQQEPLDPAWEALFNLVKRKRQLFGLSRFARFCSASGIAPEQVNDAVVDEFARTVREDGLIRLPFKVHRTTCTHWNWAVINIPGWPPQTLTVPEHGRTFSIPLEAFPRSFAEDVEAWLDHLAGTDLLAERDFRPLRPESIKNRRHKIHAFASALVHMGRDIQTIRGLVDLVSIDAVRLGLRYFLRRAGAAAGVEERITANTQQFAAILTSIARHWIKVDAAHLALLQALTRRLNPGPAGMTPKNRAVLRQFDDPANVAALLMLPERLMAEAAHSKRPPYRRALLAQTAVLIEILLMTPLRIGNLRKLEIDGSLLRTSKRVMHLGFVRDDVKNRVDIDAVLPPEAAGLIATYIERYRPDMLTEPSNWLFPGLNGQPKAIEVIRTQLKECLLRRCGLRLHPHAYRHVAVKLLYERNPGAHELARLLLGHKSAETTARYYAGMEGAAAARHYDAQILNLRASIRKSGERARKRRE